ncbi:MAG: DUF2062 domain-containing protein [Myxococcales bacterium]|nr:MAG: DUF2062 domain-containing protein [Myxococcales bacterium]
MGWRDSVKALLKKHVLGVNDTPHRIAFGVFLGCLVGCTPTMGLQIAIYLTMATALRANKLSGIPIVLVTNPLTAVPLYYLSWKLGSFTMHGRWPQKKVASEVARHSPSLSHWLDQLFDSGFWINLWDKAMDVGAEIWVGSLLIGVVTGAIAYVFSYKMVLAYRARRHHHHPHETEHDT